MTRDNVITLLKVTSDAFLSEAAEAGKTPDELFGVWVDTANNGMQRFALLSTGMVARPKFAGIEEEEARAKEIGDLRAAVVQFATAAALMLECMPAPADGEGISVNTSATGTSQPGGKLH